MNDELKLFMNRDIVDILIGDKGFKDNYGKEKKMPYLSGPDLCNISTKFGLEVSYVWGGTNKSRWVYMSDLIKYTVENKNINSLLCYLFDKNNFQKVISIYDRDSIEEKYNEIVKGIVNLINSILYFGGNELIIDGKKFIIKKIGIDVEPDSPQIRIMNIEYVQSLQSRCKKDIEDGNFDSALTKARTMIEEVLIYAIEGKGEDATKTGDINKLYNQFKDIYNMQQRSQVDKRINNLLSGLEKILSSISEMRNIDSDSHGVGRRRINIKEYHARLFINSAIVFSEFIISVYNNKIESV